MTKKTVTSLAFAAGCALALAIPAAQAQTQVWTNGPEWTPGDSSSSAMRNNAESAQYERLLQTNPGFRQARIHRECGPITDPQLHQSCLASFGQHAPSMGSSDHMMTGTTGMTAPSGAGTDFQPSRTEQGYYRIR